jgi:hypothetical protein
LRKKAIVNKKNKSQEIKENARRNIWFDCFNVILDKFAKDFLPNVAKNQN